MQVNRKYPDFQLLKACGMSLELVSEIGALPEQRKCFVVVTNTARLQSTDIDWDKLRAVIERVGGAQNVGIVAMVPGSSTLDKEWLQVDGTNDEIPVFSLSWTVAEQRWNEFALLQPQLDRMKRFANDRLQK